jgi:tetratricopeptide (TPR) repeat protein
LCDNGETPLVHRLIGLYLLKNTQRAMEEILGISEETEQKQIIEDIKTMINENKEPEEFYVENDLEFFEQTDLIWRCLAYQHQENIDTVKFNEIINTIENECKNSKKFFSPWLKTRAKVFEKGEALKENKDEQNKIIEGYKKAYDDGIAYAGGYLSQFLLEAIVINQFFYPGNVKNTNDFYGYGYALEIFGDNKQKLLDIIEESKNAELCMVFIDILNKHNPLANLINNKGLEFEQVGDFEQAIQYFSEAIRLNHVYVNAYSSLGNVYRKMGEHFIKNALVNFKIALLLDPKHENTLFWRGWLLLKKGQYENAITDFTEVININPEDSETYLRRGICYRYLENFDLAIKDYNRAIEINPNYAEAYCNRGVIHKLMGNDDKAQEDLRKAKEIDPEFYLKDNMTFFL